MEEIKLNQCGTLNHYGNEQMDRVYSSDGLSPTITVKSGGGREPKVEVKTGIRKFTEEECFRLMGVKKADFERVKKNQSATSLYHLPGDSIVTSCLMALFGQMIGIDYETKIKELVEEIKNDVKR